MTDWLTHLGQMQWNALECPSAGPNWHGTTKLRTRVLYQTINHFYNFRLFGFNWGKQGESNWESNFEIFSLCSRTTLKIVMERKKKLRAPSRRYFEKKLMWIFSEFRVFKGLQGLKFEIFENPPNVSPESKEIGKFPTISNNIKNGNFQNKCSMGYNFIKQFCDTIFDEISLQLRYLYF